MFKVGDILEQVSEGNDWENTPTAVITMVGDFIYFDNWRGRYSNRYLTKHFKIINKIDEVEMDNLLTFNDLLENEVYRVLHGGRKDHGYNYTIRNGALFNLSKNKTSSLGFNKNIRFILSDEKILKLDSLDFEVEFTSRGLKVGCQDISKPDALEIAFNILDRYSE